MDQRVDNTTGNEESGKRQLLSTLEVSGFGLAPPISVVCVMTVERHQSATMKTFSVQFVSPKIITLQHPSYFGVLGEAVRRGTGRSRTETTTFM